MYSEVIYCKAPNYPKPPIPGSKKNNKKKRRHVKMYGDKVIRINENDIYKARDILIKAGIDCEIQQGLEAGLEIEAAYRMKCAAENNKEIEKIYDHLSDDSREATSKIIAKRFNEEFIFDYDGMDDIVEEELKACKDDE